MTMTEEKKESFSPNAVTLLAIRAQSDVQYMGELWQAVERLVRLYAARYAHFGLLSADFAEDYTQQCYIALSEAVASYTAVSGTQFASWLGFYLRRALRTVLGKKTDAARHSVPAAIEDENGETLDLLDTVPDEAAARDFGAVESEDGARFLLRKIDAVCDVDGADIIKALAGGQKQRDIATHAGISLSAMQSSLIRARSRLYHDREMRNTYTEWYGTTLHKGFAAFNSSWSSVVEDAVLRREELRRGRDA